MESKTLSSTIGFFIPILALCLLTNGSPISTSVSETTEITETNESILSTESFEERRANGTTKANLQLKQEIVGRSSNNNTSNSDSSASGGLIAGVIIGAIVGILFCCCCLFCLAKASD